VHAPVRVHRIPPACPFAPVRALKGTPSPTLTPNRPRAPPMAGVPGQHALPRVGLLISESTRIPAVRCSGAHAPHSRRTTAKLIRFHAEELPRITARARGHTPACFIRETALGAIATQPGPIRGVGALI
jgi:hypothetical protein